LENAERWGGIMQLVEKHVIRKNHKNYQEIDNLCNIPRIFTTLPII